jgi:signal transduction histidine kinase/ActR/RegA family two-component response regulator
MDAITATTDLRRRTGICYFLAALLTGVALLVRMSWGADGASPFLPFVAAVGIAAFVGGTGPGVLAALLSILLGGFFILPPRGAFELTPEGWTGLIYFVVVCGILLTLNHLLLRKHAELIEAQEALSALNAELDQRVTERTHSLELEMEARSKSEEQLRQVQKMEAVGQLTGGIAHDFNNMLAIIVGSLDNARGRLTGAEHPKVKQCIENALEGATRAAVLTSRLLAFSRRQPLAPAAVDANKIVSGMSELLRRTLGEQIMVETVLAGGLWRSFADAPQLESAILNLAVNARDAMPNGGRLTIETANTYLDEAYCAAHAEVQPGQYVMISVSDTGTGMPPEVAEHAFDPFYTTKGVGRGTGLGLSQVFGYVKQSRGHIKIYTEVGKGTALKIYLPRHLGPGEEKEVSPSTQETPLGNPSTIILVVEDEDDVRHVVVDTLRELGYTVVQASSANQALEQLTVQPRIDLLLTDIVMPGQTGRQLADEVQRARPEIKILYMTGYTRNAVVHNGMLDPGVNLIPKPFTRQQIAAKLDEVLKQT